MTRKNKKKSKSLKVGGELCLNGVVKVEFRNRTLKMRRSEAQRLLDSDNEANYPSEDGW